MISWPGLSEMKAFFQLRRRPTKRPKRFSLPLVFKVEVASVTTTLQKGKVKRFGRNMGRRDHVKKAYVALKAGQELNFSGESA